MSVFFTTSTHKHLSALVLHRKVLWTNNPRAYHTYTTVSRSQCLHRNHTHPTSHLDEPPPPRARTGHRSDLSYSGVCLSLFTRSSPRSVPGHCGLCPPFLPYRCGPTFFSYSDPCSHFSSHNPLVPSSCPFPLLPSFPLRSWSVRLTPKGGNEGNILWGNILLVTMLHLYVQYTISHCIASVCAIYRYCWEHCNMLGNMLKYAVLTTASTLMTTAQNPLHSSRVSHMKQHCICVCMLRP